MATSLGGGIYVKSSFLSHYMIITKRRLIGNFKELATYSVDGFHV